MSRRRKFVGTSSNMKQVALIEAGGGSLLEDAMDDGS
jgi:hypothetical protein